MARNEPNIAKSIASARLDIIAPMTVRVEIRPVADNGRVCGTFGAQRQWSQNAGVFREDDTG